MAGVGLLLLIVCLNVSHLLLARAINRQREMSVRAALGASRGRLVRQLLTEAALLSGLGAAVGLGLTRWLSNGLVALATSGSRFSYVDVRTDGRVLVFTLLLALATAVLLGLVPARQAARRDLQQTLRASSRTASASRRLGSQLLLASQVAFSLVLLVGAGLLAGTLRNLRGLDRGVDQEHIVLMWVSTEFSGLDAKGALALQDEIIRQVSALPGVESASLSFGGDLQGGGFPRNVRLPDGTVQRAPFASVTASYFATAGLRLVAGRALTRDDRATAPRVAVINQSLARQLFGDGVAVGKRFRLDEKMESVEVVGVLRDVRTGGLRGETQPLAYVPAAQSDVFLGSLEVRTTGDPGLVGDQVRRLVLEIQPNLPVRNVRTAKIELERGLWRERLLAVLSSAFGLAALFLVCVGLYGVISQWAGQRTREIGVRMALGATAASVRWLVLRQALVLVGAGVAVGLPAAMAASRLLEGTLFGVRPADPGVLTLAALVMFAVAALAAYAPARRAAALDPMVALRQE
jgi:predicted permease